MNSTNTFYENNSQTYIQQTIGLDMSHKRNDFLKHIKHGGHILDVGCGSARDSIEFERLGFKVSAIDTSEKFCENARTVLNGEVRCVSILDYISNNKFDGIWCSASLLHLTKDDFKRALIKIQNLLETDGSLYISLKQGYGESLDSNGRYFSYYQADELNQIL